MPFSEESSSQIDFFSLHTNCHHRAAHHRSPTNNSAAYHCSAVNNSTACYYSPTDHHRSAYHCPAAANHHTVPHLSGGASAAARRPVLPRGRLLVQLDGGGTVHRWVRLMRLSSASAHMPKRGVGMRMRWTHANDDGELISGRETRIAPRRFTIVKLQTALR